MRRSIIRLATASSSLPLSVQQASAQLVPPIPLYRLLLRAHRSLDPEMRFMGDSYVKSEFRLTRSTENPLHIIGFLSQWKHYLDEIQQTKVDWNGRKLDQAAFEKMSPEQVGQLYELMHATKEVWKSTEQLEEEARSAESGGLPSTDTRQDPKK